MKNAQILNHRSIICWITLLALCGCGQLQSSTPALTAPVVEISTTTPTITPTTTPTATPAPTATPLGSTMVLGISSTTIKTIYDQAHREAVARGIPYFFWPDSNIAFLPNGNQFRFFAPNGPRTAITLGTFDDPGAKLVVAKMAIKGIDRKFPFASSGSIYRDPQSGMLLMFYHAEDHFGGDGHIFHSFIGLAVSNDDGKTFQNLGIILSSNAEPDVNARCCVDMGGATYIIRDDKFYLYFRDRLRTQDDINLALATAPVAEVLEAARNGKTSPWFKYYNGEQEPGLSGRSSPLERGNPFITWMGVSYNEYLKKYIMAVSYHPGEDMYDSNLYLISSDDGITWSPRVPLLLHCDCWLTYATIISPDGQVNTGSQFYIFYDSTARGKRPYADTSLQRMTVTLTGSLVEAAHAWEFETSGDTEGWMGLNQLSPLQVTDGHLVTQSTGDDPYMISSFLAVDAKRYPTVQINMKVSAGDAAQLFFLADSRDGYAESNSVRFAIQPDGQFHTYSLDMSKAAGWSGLITQLRLDPVQVPASLEIDYIRITGQ